MLLRDDQARDRVRDNKDLTPLQMTKLENRIAVIVRRAGDDGISVQDAYAAIIQDDDSGTTQPWKKHVSIDVFTALCKRMQAEWDARRASANPPVVLP